MGVRQTYNSSAISLDSFTETYKEAVAHLFAISQNDKLKYILPYCRNEHELCIQWAALGWCDEDPHYMEKVCCPACKSAEMVDWLIQCPMDIHAPHAWKPGDLNKFFKNLSKRKEYEPTVHSRPQGGGPWIVTLENVISEQEANAIIEWGEVYGWEDSLVDGDVQEDGTWEAVWSEDRTSSLAWCIDECMEDPIMQRVLDRISNITNMHSNHSDYMQILRYESGQFYLNHHDFHHYQVYSSSGPRIMTVYIYLRNVSKGGGTRFPYLDITVTPKLGRALIWPNVLNEDPNVQDQRTHHEALPPIGDQKYGATLWWHQRDFKTADAQGCAQ